VRQKDNIIKALKFSLNKKYLEIQSIEWLIVSKTSPKKTSEKNFFMSLSNHIFL